ncbi:hypothetical protein [Sphingomonas beigongshangi]|uniref:hypothetical protein n=1 Tax=Sphingomonas beigongshangi TaxID=2782540 RepID=UPI00193B6689|nr:hypothetical protein [Sphingomonas beigongshangi]
MTHPMNANPVKIAALSLLNHPEPTLNYKSGQFLGGIAFSDQPLTERQERWLSDLLRKHGLPPLVSGDKA